MTTPSQTIVAGIDIGKSGLDAHLEPGGQARHFANTKAGRRALRNWLAKNDRVDAGTAAELGDPLIQLFDELIGKADTALQACIASDPELARRAAIIRSIPGFGPANAASLCADMPELGSINRRQAAASIRATCSTWPPLRQSASIPRCKLSSSASAPAASSTRSPWSPSCAS